MVRSEPPIAVCHPERVAGRTHAADVMARAAQGVVVAAVALVPLIFLPFTSDVFNLAKVATVIVAVAVAGSLWVVSSSERQSWVPAPSVLRWVGLYVLVFACATALSEARVVSVFGLYHRYGGLIPLLSMLAFGAVIVGLFAPQPARVMMLGAARAAAPAGGGGGAGPPRLRGG